MTTPSERAKRQADEAIRVLPNDDGVWGIDVQGTWFPFDDDTEADVREIAEGMKRAHAINLDAFAADAVREERARNRDRILALRNSLEPTRAMLNVFLCDLAPDESTPASGEEPEILTPDPPPFKIPPKAPRP